MKRISAILVAVCALGCAGTVNLADESPTRCGWQSYEVYSPKVETVVISEGQFEEGQFPYNHCASVEFFDGLFYAVWQANATSHEEGRPNQKIYLSTSKDFKTWSEPVNFVTADAANPIGETTYLQNQPNLLNYHGKELWCIWFFQSKNEDERGIYLSKKAKGKKWVNNRIHVTEVIDGLETFAYTAQNPVLLSTGRVICPLVFIQKNYTHETRRTVKRYAGFIYTDDDGETWQTSNFISSPEDKSAMWEPYGYEQDDGTLRVIVRNLSQARKNTPLKAMMTCTGTGLNKGEKLVLETDPQYMAIETISSRPQTIKYGSRYIMLHNDVYCLERPFENRLQGAMFFSRTGEDDFIAGPSFTDTNEICAYPQCVEHDGNLYVVYTRLNYINQPRSIVGTAVKPLPDEDKYYIFPTDKDLLELTPVRTEGVIQWQRVNKNYTYERPAVTPKDGVNALRFTERGRASVDIDPVDLEEGDELSIRFRFMIEQVQEYGNLILCSFGDRLPVRIAVPSNRSDRLYAYSADGWQPVGQVERDQWMSLKLTFKKDSYDVQLDDDTVRGFQYAVRKVNPRFYLGDGYEVDHIPSNQGSTFYIDVGSLKTKAVPKTNQRRLP